MFLRTSFLLSILSAVLFVASPAKVLLAAQGDEHQNSERPLSDFPVSEKPLEQNEHDKEESKVELEEIELLLYGLLDSDPAVRLVEQFADSDDLVMHSHLVLLSSDQCRAPPSRCSC